MCLFLYKEGWIIVFPEGSAYPKYCFKDIFVRKVNDLYGLHPSEKRGKLEEKQAYIQRYFEYLKADLGKIIYFSSGGLSIDIKYDLQGLFIDMRVGYLSLLFVKDLNRIIIFENDKKIGDIKSNTPVTKELLDDYLYQTFRYAVNATYWE